MEEKCILDPMRDCLESQYYFYNKYSYKVQTGGSMIPCVWSPNSGIWQWEEVE